MAQLLQLRRDTATAWASVNPILANGEIGLELVTKLFKIGDGINHWNSLSYSIIDISTAVIAAEAKITPNDTDLLGIIDSAEPNILKKLTWANLKATLKTYLDTLYDVASSAAGAITVHLSAFAHGDIAHTNRAALNAVIGTNTGDKTLSELGGVTANGAITGATKTKITYDTKGLVTGGADATTADIADSTDKRYCTDVQQAILVNIGSSVDVKHYRSVLGFYAGDGAATGTIKITLPRQDTTMMVITIIGYNYSIECGFWKLIIGGFVTTPGWSGSGARNNMQIFGRAPFTSVRLGYDGSNPVILLGVITSTWSYGSFEITDVLASYNHTSGWNTGWTATLITSESGITNISTPQT